MDNPSLLQRRHLPLALLALLFSGAFQALAAPPRSIWWLELVGWLPALWVFSRLEGWRALLAGWLVGIVANVALFSWIAHTVTAFAHLPLPVAAGILLAFGALWGAYLGAFALGVRAVRRASGSFWPLGLALWFVACEYLNPQLFPYFQGALWYRQTGVFLLSSLTGVSGVTFLILLLNATLMAAMERRTAPSLPRRALPQAAAGLVLWVAIAVGWSSWEIARVDAAEAAAPTTLVALIQPDQRVEQILSKQAKDPGWLLRDFLKLSEEVEVAHPDVEVYVWPEGAIRGGPENRRNRDLIDFARSADAEVWTGATISQGKKPHRTHHGSAWRVRADGQVDPPYIKSVLLPFGEYMPLVSVFPFLKAIQGVGNYTPGDGPVLFHTPAGEASYVICYEAIRPRYVRRAVAQGADLLVNGTYEGWFGDTACPRQHLMLAAVQAASHGVPMIRAATTGISAFIDGAGRVQRASPVFERTALLGEARHYLVPTPYAAIGDWFAWLSIVLGFGLLEVGLRRPDTPWDRRAWLVVVLFVASAPVAWIVIRSAPIPDWLTWAFAMLVVVTAPLQGWRR